MHLLNKELKRKLKKDITKLLRETTVRTNNQDFVKVKSAGENFKLIGQGCSSAVFRWKKAPFVAVKVYSREHRKEAFLEACAYKTVQGIEYFPSLYSYGPDYLALEYIEGKSLYECIIEGIIIPDWVIEAVDKAINLARDRGLKPSDVHFKNIILQPDRVMLIDLSDYLTAKHVSRWEKLKFFYKAIYRPLLRGVKIPKYIVDFTRKAFKSIEAMFSKT